jgi:uncharacterized membrane protein YqaE (UPF0057 family)
MGGVWIRRGYVAMDCLTELLFALLFFFRWF